MDSLGNMLYYCTLLHIICENLHDLYTLNSLSGWKGLKKFIPRDSFNSSLYILFSMVIMLKMLMHFLGSKLFCYLKKNIIRTNWCHKNFKIFHIFKKICYENQFERFRNNIETVRHFTTLIQMSFQFVLVYLLLCSYAEELNLNREIILFFVFA